VYFAHFEYKYHYIQNAARHAVFAILEVSHVTLIFMFLTCSNTLLLFGFVFNWFNRTRFCQLASNNIYQQICLFLANSSQLVTELYFNF